MGAVVGGMTLLQLLQVVGAAGSVVEEGIKIANDLHAKGGSAGTPLEPEHLDRVRAVVGVLGARALPNGSDPSPANIASGGRGP